jgi:hypothetical protein
MEYDIKTKNLIFPYYFNEEINNISTETIIFSDSPESSIYNIKIDNLPLTIKEIVITDEEFKKFIKIPFDSILTIQK